MMDSNILQDQVVDENHIQNMEDDEVNSVDR